MSGVAIEDLLELWSAELRKEGQARLVDWASECCGLGGGFPGHAVNRAGFAGGWLR